MKFYELRKQITEAYGDYWHHINGGSQFHYDLGTVNDLASVFGYHSARAVLLNDVDIAIEYGMTDDPLDRQAWVADWAPFPDPNVHGKYADVFYRGALVDRVHLASVDGGRAFLPAPTITMTSGSCPTGSTTSRVSSTTSAEMTSLMATSDEAGLRSCPLSCPDRCYMDRSASNSGRAW